ncbi:MAG: MobC family plasmid mobilization relaxosome protein [Clostridiales bacterium]|nr:MobC family plasmid mobilization relaxosome protein [Clostridiales bacterium]
MARDEFIRARVAGWEKRYITDKAKKAHMSESEFVRRAAMNKEVAYIEGLDGLITELRHQGNNLNQLTILARQGRIDFLDYKPFMEVYREVWQALNLLASRVV